MSFKTFRDHIQYNLTCSYGDT